MGTASVELYESVMKRILDRYGDQVRVLRATDMGDGVTLYRIESILLKQGHNGTVNAILDGGKLRFRRDADT